jgi:hypothetical protein
MMHLLELIENSGFSTWIRESPSLFAYTLILSLHAIGLAIIVGVSWIVALRMLGVWKSIPFEPLFNLFPLMYAGFYINAISGILLLSAETTTMLTMVMFYLKMAFIVAAMITLRLVRRRFVAGTAETQSHGLAWAVIGFWFGAIIAGRLTSYPYFVDSWFGL